MPTPRALLAVAFFVCGSFASFAACDSSEDAPKSTFDVERRFARTMGGRVRSDVEAVDDAVVRIDPSAFSGADVGWDAAIAPPVTTNESGSFQFEFSPNRYDLTIRRGHELVAVREITYSYFEPQIGGVVTPRAFASRLSVALEPPVPAGFDVAFFPSGDDVVALDGTLESGLTVKMRSFDGTFTLNAVQFPKDAGLTAAVAFGRTDVRVRSDGVYTATIQMAPSGHALDPDAAHYQPSFAVTPPAGFTVQPLDIYLDFGSRPLGRKIASVAAGTPLPIEFVPFARWSAYVRATTTDGALSESDANFFDLAADVVEFELPAPPVPVVATSSSVTGVAEGVREHLLVPEDPNGITLRVLSVDREVTLPATSAFGLPTPSGRYTWTVRHWPKSPTIVGAAGTEARILVPYAVSAPQIVELH